MTLVGEAADDGGGVFDETMAQMCEVRSCPLLKMFCTLPEIVYTFPGFLFYNMYPFLLKYTGMNDSLKRFLNIFM